MIRKNFILLVILGLIALAAFSVFKVVQPVDDLNGEIYIELDRDAGEIQLSVLRADNGKGLLPVPTALPLGNGVQTGQDGNRTERRETVKLYNVAENKIETLDITEYLVGVLAGEMPAGYDMEALKAQAVAARTYLERKMSCGGCDKKEGADICSSSNHCQCYKSKKEQQKLWGEDYETYYKKLRAAVTATAGQIMFYNGQVIDALYHSSSAGSTEACAAVYGNSLSYLVSVESYEQPDAVTVQQSFTRREFIDMINSKVKNANLSESGLHKQVSITAKTDSGRVATVRTGNKEISAVELRKLLGIRSTSFRISFDSDYIYFTVSGFGHGLGMSQCGANVLAKQGKDYLYILKHYYTGVTIE